MSFDQFQRYKTVQIIVDKIKQQTGQERVSILEIGGNGQCNLGEMLPQEKIQYSNLTIPEERIGDDRFIAVDGTDMPEVGTDAYDVVIALDVFEHVPVEKRGNFLAETHRVAKYMTILCFPFANGQNESAERRVNNYYKAIYGKNHVWLEEHIGNGLPSLENTERYLEENKISYQIFQHGDIVVWEEWMKALFGSYDIPGAADYVDSLEEYYEQNLYFHDIGEYNYRVFLTMAKDKKLGNKIAGEVDRIFSALDEHEVREQMFRGLTDLKQLCSRKACRKVVSSLYMDCGNGFSEINKQVSEAMADHNGKMQIGCEFPVPENCIGLRFDPVEDCGCVITGLKVSSDAGEITPLPVNGWKKDDTYVFAGNDPQIMLAIADKKIMQVKIEGMLRLCGADEGSMVMEIADKMVGDSVRKAEEAVREKEDMVRICHEYASEKDAVIKERDMIAEERDVAIRERDMIAEMKQKLAEQLNEMTAKADLYETAYQGVVNSRTWKLTGPLRIVFGKKR